MHALVETSELHRKSLPWIFYGQTTSLCETCFELVPAKIIGEDGKVFYQKRCSQHGVMKTLIEEEENWGGEVWLTEDREEIDSAHGSGRREYGLVHVWWD